MFAASMRFRNKQRGQTTLTVVLVLGIFLLGFIALAVDFSNLWFKRQAAQGVADAVCQAAAVNLLIQVSKGAPTAGQGFTPGTPFDCSANTGWAACQYAQINGFSLSGISTPDVEGNEVHVSFPSSVTGITTPPSSIAGSYPFIRADATDRSRVFFTTLFTGKHTQDVVANSVCGLTQSLAPIPLIVLHPSCSHSFEISGSGSLAILGGPVKSVQVNSDNQTCAAATGSTQCNGNGTIDLSAGGPNFSGSNFGVYGLPTSSNAPGNYLPGTTGSWRQPSLPIPDPYALTPVPTRPSAAPAPSPVGYHVWGCPDTAGCTLYQPGLYTQPIIVAGATAIFAKGVYYMEPTSYPGASSSGGNCGSPSSCATKPTGQCNAALLVDSNGVVRPAIDPATGDDKAGIMFYFSGTPANKYAAAVFGSNAGKSGGRTIDVFDTTRMICPGASAPDARANVPATVPGNVLMGECTKSGTYIDALANPSEAAGKARGLLYFQDHANADPKGQTNMQGGGGLALAGTLYLHNCTATPCLSTDYQAFLQLQGTPGSGTYVFGEIVADQFELAGNGAVAMQLSADKTIDVLKVQLLQ
jgi:hypothetical protein